MWKKCLINSINSRGFGVERNLHTRCHLSIENEKMQQFIRHENQSPDGMRLLQISLINDFFFLQIMMKRRETQLAKETRGKLTWSNVSVLSLSSRANQDFLALGIRVTRPRKSVRMSESKKEAWEVVSVVFWIRTHREPSVLVFESTCARSTLWIKYCTTIIDPKRTGSMLHNSLTLFFFLFLAR